MVGAIFIGFVLCLFVVMLVKGITRWRQGFASKRQSGLIVGKYLNEAGACMVTLQVLQEEQEVEISPNLYPKIQPPIRGELIFHDQLAIDFIPAQK